MICRKGRSDAFPPDIKTTCWQGKLNGMVLCDRLSDEALPMVPTDSLSDPVIDNKGHNERAYIVDT